MKKSLLMQEAGGSSHVVHFLAILLEKITGIEARIATSLKS